jgi:uncharacterized protein YbcI
MGAGIRNGNGRGLIPADERVPDHGLGGELNASIARAVVRIYHAVCGRGSTKASATYRGDVVVVVLEQVLTQGERSLVAGGRRDEALAVRRKLHDAMRDELTLAVGELTRCRVRALLGDAHLDPDIAVEVFVLDRAVDPTPFTAPAG